MRPSRLLPLLAAVGMLFSAVHARAEQTISYPPSHPTVRFTLADGWTFTQAKGAQDMLSAHANSNPQAELFVSRSAGVYADEADCVATLRKTILEDTAAPGYSEVKFGPSGTKNFGTIQMHYLPYSYKYNGDSFTAVYSAFTAPGGKETYFFLRRANDLDREKFTNDFKLLNTSLQPIR